MSSPHALPRHRRDHKPWQIGIVGGGDISGQYSRLIDASDRFDLVGVVGRGQATDTLLDNEDIDIIVNLTPPLAHHEVSARALAAGKHVYSEKPLAHDLANAQDLIHLADRQGVALACAPAIFLGPALQTAAACIQRGDLGEVIGARGITLYRGPDLWHANPAPLFGKAAGPLFDMGTYHIAALIALLGNVASVNAMGGRAHDTRVVGKGPKAGATFKVDVQTHVCALLRFESGAIADLTFSFDGMCSDGPALEIYGTKASLSLPHPALFSGDVKVASTYGQWEKVEPEIDYWDDDLWIAGLHALADHLDGLEGPWPTPQRALHGLEVLVAIEKSMTSGVQETIRTSCERPTSLPASTFQRWRNAHMEVS